MTTATLPDPRRTALSAELLPLLDVVREAVADQLFGPTRHAVNRFLADAPIGACVKLYEAWAAANAAGLMTDPFLDTLTPENRFILDLVSTIYSVPDGNDSALFPDYRELSRIAEGEVVES